MSNTEPNTNAANVSNEQTRIDHKQRELNKLAALWVLANVCLFGWFVWANWKYL